MTRLQQKSTTVSESQIEQKLRRKIISLGGVCIKQYSGFTGVDAGVPDRLVKIPGDKAFLHFVELKKETGSLSLKQRLYMHNMISVGCPCYVVKGPEGAKEYLAALAEKRLPIVTDRIICFGGKDYTFSR